MKMRFSAFLVFLATIWPLFSGSQNRVVPKNTPSGSLRFEENRNQYDPVVLFKTDLLSNGKLFFEKNMFTYLFVNGEDLEQQHHPWHAGAGHPTTGIIHYHCFKTEFLSSNPKVQVQASGAFPEYKNYYQGSDPAKWAPGVKLFASLSYSELYPSIDMEVYSSGFNLIYDFTVNTGGDPTNIQMNYSGANKVYLQGGLLHIETSLSDVIEQKPTAYQIIDGKKIFVECNYVLKGTKVSFGFPRGYNVNEPLIIDPTLICSTFTGSTTDNWGYTATYDASGNIYSAGIANGTGYPVTLGAFQTTFGGGGSGGNFYLFDISITKYNPSGTALIYSTYLGGSDNEQPQSLVVDNAGNLVVIGRTYSTNYPVTASAFQTTNGGGSDIVVTKFNPSGTTLIGSTYMGGSGEDGVNIAANWSTFGSLKYNYGDDSRSDIITDNTGNCYVASCTQSPNFPVTTGAFQQTFGGGLQDGCVFKLNNNLSNLVYSTYLGGSGDDGCYGLALGGGNTLYVTGGTGSTNFPVTPGSLLPVYQGGSSDGFVTHLNNTGSAVLQSTFIGTAGYDQSHFVQVDRNNNVYLYGQTSGAYPITAGVYHNSNSGQFIHKLNPVLSATVYSTVFGAGTGAPDISPSAFMVDTCENVYTSGWGGSCIPYGRNGSTNGLPVTANAYQSTTDGCDFYFFVLKKNAVSLWYATYFGGGGHTDEHVDGGTSRFDKNGVIYQSVCAGCGGSSNFPTTPGAWSVTNNSTNCNNAVVKMAFELVNLHAIARAAPSDTICIGGSAQFVNTSSGAQNYLWNFGDGSARDTGTAPTHIYTVAGTYTVSLLAIDSASCKLKDSTHLLVYVVPPPSINLGRDTTICGVVNLLLNAGNPGAQYLWSTGNTSATVHITSPGTYWVKVKNGQCAASDTIVIRSLVAPKLGNDTTLCQGASVLLNAGLAASSYSWSTGAVTQTISVSTSGTYYVKVFSGCFIVSDSVKVTFVPTPIVNLGPDTLLCPNASLTLSAGNTGSSFIWSTGSSSSSISVSTSGNYWVKVSDGGCINSDSIAVSKLKNENLGPDQFLCNMQSPILLDAGRNQGARFLWSNGDTTQTIYATQPGIFWVIVRVASCRLSDTLIIDGGLGGPPDIYVPDAFSPNGDGLNDVFLAEGIDVTYFDMKIFNRWGELFYESTDITKGWDGTLKGNPVPGDIYVWVMDYSNVCTGRRKVHNVGHVMVYR
jgi:gliding motility-associated-like protein